MFARRKWIVSGIVGGAVALFLSACSGAAMATQEANEAESYEYTEAPTEAAAIEDIGSGGGLLPVPSEAEAPDGVEGNKAGPDQALDPLVAALPQDRLIIKKGEMTLLVENTQSAIDQVTQIAVDNGGYVLSTQASLTNKVMDATITIAVRAAEYEAAMRRLRAIAIEVQGELSTGEDVTAEYVDLDSRLANLEATRDRIKDFLDKAKTVEEALKVNQQLADIEGEIEQVKGRMNYLSGRAAFSTITITLYQQTNATPTPTPTSTPTPTPTPPWSLSPTVEKAAGAQVSIVRALLEMAVWIIFVPGPYVLVAGLALWGFQRWIVRRPQPPQAPPPASP